MKAKPLHCPKCNARIEIRATALYDDGTVDIKAVHYDLLCMKCNTEFSHSIKDGKSMSIEEFGKILETPKNIKYPSNAG